MAGKKKVAPELKKGGAGSLQQQFVKIMTEQGKPSDLWTIADMMEVTGLEKRQVENALSNAWRGGKIDRHRVNGDSTTGQGSARFALKLKDADKQTYVPFQASGAGSPKRRGVKATPKEIRMAFMQVQNSLAKLEDMIMPVVEDAEEKDKVLNKLKSML